MGLFWLNALCLMDFYQKIPYAIKILAILVLLAYYFVVEPSQSSYLPCPIYTLTGLKCGGCGIQRALHHALHLRFGEALRLNYLSIFIFIYLFLLIGLATPNLKNKRLLNLKHLLYTEKALLIVLLVLILFMIFRNLINH